MNARERFREAMLFGQPDKVPLEPGGPRESTLEAWHRQGLPNDADWRAYLWGILDIRQEPVATRGRLPVTFKMLPTFEEKVLEHRDGHYIVQDGMGAIVEISDRYDNTYLREAKDFVTRKWHRFPVRTRQDWEEKLKWRYDPRHPERFPKEFQDRCRALRDHDDALRLDIPGLFWQLREWCMRSEVMRVVPLIQEGGYIPGCDHGVPPDVSWSSFIEYTRLLARLTGWL